MDECTEEEIEEIQKRIKAACKQHHWIQLEDPNVFKCAICESLNFTEDITLELLEKYLLS